MGVRSDIFQELNRVCDPEIPGVTIFEMGILRDVTVNSKGIIIKITPTYCGCPALKAVEDDVYITLKRAGYKNVQVKTIYSPAWTTDWLNSKTKEKLRRLGIAPPPKKQRQSKNDLTMREEVSCARCGSIDTKLLSPFGSTPCKALFYCKNCLEPFDYFKCI